MKKIKAGIVGYGNLGKSVEKFLLEDERFELCYVFSRRSVSANVPVVPYSQILDFEGKVDVLFLCGGSKSDTEQQAEFLCGHFNTIDSFDNHNRIEKYIKTVDKICKKGGKTNICCCGWDPGLFSLMRVIFNAVSGNAYTFWGKGVSQGHSQALRNIPGVLDAIEYTLPNEEIVEQIAKGIAPKCDKKKLHKRECFVVTDQDKDEITKQIVNMPDYFEGYDTEIHFVENLDDHKKLFHAGQVLTLGKGMEFSVSMQSNPDFTAKIMIVYSIALSKLFNAKQFGCHSIMDIPARLLLDENPTQFI